MIDIKVSLPSDNHPLETGKVCLRLEHESESVKIILDVFPTIQWLGDVYDIVLKFNFIVKEKSDDKCPSEYVDKVKETLFNNAHVYLENMFAIYIIETESGGKIGYGIDDKEDLFGGEMGFRKN